MSWMRHWCRALPRALFIATTLTATPAGACPSLSIAQLAERLTGSERYEFAGRAMTPFLDLWTQHGESALPVPTDGVTLFVRVERIYKTVASTVYRTATVRIARRRRAARLLAAIYRRISDRRRTPLAPGAKRRSSRRPARKNASHAAVGSTTSGACHASSSVSTGRITPIGRPRWVKGYDARASLT